MPKLPSSKQIEKVLHRQGFYFVSQKGSHIKYRKEIDRVYTVIVPANKKEIPVGTFRYICRQAGLKEDNFR
ncbi:type II toxin-antitoxin system HicA family toxin [Candidatus Berkelbacteria bacterium CG10_big_fil_rev_8_21_14_0_10_43_14]|uniref:Type II toxin-antitoxin system HicA family toxin n=1 Tax=Candidatus Berkelbacteria bacterium CG10_big_fil_rev_8_21_14_0_10_43_14 TaxID=1974515 RepID=A0A2M6R924_9BACT|nr:MAG: type II toxin-antitoxin system HicA family toxin [Candidatus Berkelbacteria bacterium CG10_big_fil_rev_8_21_14_0_10_43_14]